MACFVRDCQIKEGTVIGAMSQLEYVLKYEKPQFSSSPPEYLQAHTIHLFGGTLVGGEESTTITMTLGSLEQWYVTSLRVQIQVQEDLDYKTTPKRNPPIFVHPCHSLCSKAYPHIKTTGWDRGMISGYRYDRYDIFYYRIFCHPITPACLLPRVLLILAISGWQDETPKLLLHTAAGFCVICMREPRDPLTSKSSAYLFMKEYTPEGPSTQYFRTLVPKAINGMAFGIRVHRYWVLGPSGYLK